MTRIGPSLCALLVVALLAASCSDGGAGDGETFDPAAAAAGNLDDVEPTLDEAGNADPESSAGASSTTSTPSTTTSTTTTTTTIPGIVVNEYLLSIDECFNRVEDLSAGRARTVTTLVDCENPHRFQIFSNLQYPGDPGVPYPGDDIVEDFALAACYQRFEAWADSVYETSVLEIRAFTPNRDNFESQGYRGIQCYVERTDGEPLIGTARAAGL